MPKQPPGPLPPPEHPHHPIPRDPGHLPHLPPGTVKNPRPQAEDWDIVGGPGHPPQMPNPADYAPGGKWYGLVSYSAAMNHYWHAEDAYHMGYWYHGNYNNFTAQQMQFNQSYTGFTHFGVQTGGLINPNDPNQWHPDFHYEWQVDPATGIGEWHQISNPGAGNNGGGGNGGSGGGGGGGGTGGSGGAGGGGNLPGFSDSQQSAYDLFRNLLTGWGLPFGEDIADIIKKAVIDGVSPDQIDLILPDIQATQTWNNRFPGWAARVKNGYNQISVGEYLQLENTYHSILQSAGLPKGFYDDPGDFGNWIANNVSPDEIQSRVGVAVTAAQQVNPTVRNLMAKFYGLGTGDVASYFLDTNRALPIIQRQFNSANVAAWASRNGFAVTNMTHYEDLVDSGISADQAASAYSTIRSLTDTVGRAGAAYGINYDQYDAERDVFFNNSDKRRRIMAQEAATFGGSSQGSTGSAKRQSY